ncbi:hypothetical protein GIB67_008038 [Kingdonia uniflora]|uniref:Uncharacterized protein n=1 Tax=Kingdonia uniflora TaxID=39325 RepID=A0A7J7MNI6_9MAGN|nr:hypothetical protein GIB67_008038 [Kingdonia uniflora]
MGLSFCTILHQDIQGYNIIDDIGYNIYQCATNDHSTIVEGNDVIYQLPSFVTSTIHFIDPLMLRTPEKVLLVPLEISQDLDECIHNVWMIHIGDYGATPCQIPEHEHDGLLHVWNENVLHNDKEETMEDLEDEQIKDLDKDIQVVMDIYEPAGMGTPNYDYELKMVKTGGLKRLLEVLKKEEKLVKTPTTKPIVKNKRWRYVEKSNNDDEDVVDLRPPYVGAKRVENFIDKLDLQGCGQSEKKRGWGEEGKSKGADDNESEEDGKEEGEKLEKEDEEDSKEVDRDDAEEEEEVDEADGKEDDGVKGSDDVLLSSYLE